MTDAFNTIVGALSAFGSQAATVAARLPDQAVSHPVLAFQAVALLAFAVIRTGAQVR